MSSEGEWSWTESGELEVCNICMLCLWEEYIEAGRLCDELKFEVDGDWANEYRGEGEAQRKGLIEGIILWKGSVGKKNCPVSTGLWGDWTKNLPSEVKNGLIVSRGAVNSAMKALVVWVPLSWSGTKLSELFDVSTSGTICTGSEAIVNVLCNISKCIVIKYTLLPKETDTHKLYCYNYTHNLDRIFCTVSQVDEAVSLFDGSSSIICLISIDVSKDTGVSLNK